MAAVVVLPIDASSGSPSYTSQETREAFSAFLGIAPSGRPVGAVSGVRPGTGENTVTSTSSTWSCASHSGVVDAETPALAGPYLYATDGSDSGAVNAPNATNPRIDIVFVRVWDDDQDSTGLRKAEVDYLAGTAASSPVPPSAPSRSMVLAQINVPKSGGGSPSVDWVAPVFGAVPFARVNKTNAQNIAGATDVQLTYQNDDDTTAAAWSGMADSGNNRLVILVPGVYLIDCLTAWDASAGGGRETRIQVNGSNVHQTKKPAMGAAWSGAGGDPQPASCLARLDVGDHVTVVVTQNSGGTIQVDATGGVIGYLAATYIGP
jgi:hypothetical protein